MSNIKILQKSGWYILASLSIVPAILWLFEPGLAFKFFDLSIGLRSLGDVFGLCGMAMFSLVVILSARLRFLERFFKGMNESYTVHHFFGGLAFCFLLFHPLLIAYDYTAISFRATALFLLPGANWAHNYGTIGLFVMIITLVITFYTKLKYHIWEFTHKFLGIAFFFAFLHTFLIGFDVASNYWLKAYLFMLGIAAILAYFYRTLFYYYFVKTFAYKVKEIKQYPDKIWEVEFTPKGCEIKFKPGQFVFIKFYKSYLLQDNESELELSGRSELGQDSRREERTDAAESHPFTISSAPGFPLKLAIKELGDFTSKIGELRAGDLATVEGPYGVFDFRSYDNKKQVWIAGGIGITPFLGMLRSLTEKDYEYKIDFYYSVKDSTCLAFNEEIAGIAEKYKNIKFILWNTKEKGFLNADKIKILTTDLMEREVLVCGPGIMMNSIKTQFLQEGVEKNKIHIEEFQLY